MNKVFLILFLGLAATPLLGAPSSNEFQQRFDQGNQAFEKGDLDTALEKYRSLVGQGFGGAALFYNLGNLHYRKGERGKAILWYERARRLTPRDPDIQFNLALSKSHLKDSRDPLWERLLLYAADVELSTAVTLLTWIFFLLVGAALLDWITLRPLTMTVLITTGTMLAGAALWLGGRAYVAHQPLGIVTRVPGEVRNGPGADYAVGFTVPEGSRVFVLNERPDWFQVGILDQGLKGWMPTSDVEKVNSLWASLN